MAVKILLREGKYFKIKIDIKKRKFLERGCLYSVDKLCKNISKNFHFQSKLLPFV